jgi:hypothetical protein
MSILLANYVAMVMLRTDRRVLESARQDNSDGALLVLITKQTLWHLAILYTSTILSLV